MVTKKMLRRLICWLCKTYLGDVYILIYCTRETVNGEPTRRSADTNLLNPMDVSVVSDCIAKKMMIMDQQDDLVKQVNKIVNPN